MGKPTRQEYRQAQKDIDFAVGGLKTTRELKQQAKESKNPHMVALLEMVEVEHLANIGRAYLILKGAEQ